MSGNIIDRHIGERIRVRRQLLGVRAQELAEKLDLSRQQMADCESGSRHITGRELYQLTRILDVPVSYVFRELKIDR
jgi:transcriptional regulator with XRE-family HTH domain